MIHRRRLNTVNTLKTSGRVRTLVTKSGTVGTHTAQWDGLRDGGQAAASGLYFYRLERGEQTQVRRMTLLR